MQQWYCARGRRVRWCKCETIFIFRYVMFDVNVIHIWRWIYLGVMWIMFFSVNHYLWCGLWFVLTWIVMMLVVLYVYVMYDLSLNYSGTDIKKRKSTVRSKKKWRGLRCAFVVLFAFRKFWVARIHNLFQEMRRRLKGGSVSVLKR